MQLTPQPSQPVPQYDVLILGAGGAGMMCAITAGKRGRKVGIIEHSKKPGGKIIISGGGRCNFTNLGAGPANYHSRNPHFCKSALSRYKPTDFIQMVEAHGIPYHEKKLGQQFCDGSARDIVQMLVQECNDSGAQFILEHKIEKVRVLEVNSNAVNSDPARFEVTTSRGTLLAHSLVIATGGLSIPKIGATGIGYEIARELGLKIVPRVAALDGLTLSPDLLVRFKELAGASVDCTILCENGLKFRENLLFTHSGLSGPVSLQASLQWNAGESIEINFLPDLDLFSWFKAKKSAGNRSQVKNLLSEVLPGRLSDLLCNEHFSTTLPLPQVSEKQLEAFCHLIHHFKLKPAGTVGYSKAEVTRGGVDTDELSSKTMECKKIPGLYFIGEVVDVTGWLGGYNFQWAWASAVAAGQVV